MIIVRHIEAWRDYKNFSVAMLQLIEPRHLEKKAKYQDMNTCMSQGVIQDVNTTKFGKHLK
jgi:hypothetical protein